MELPEGATDWASGSATGIYFLDLLNDPGWVLRRVETVRILDSHRIERSTTLDIDVRDLIIRATAAGITDTRRLYIPLAVLPKGLLLDIDIRDARHHVRPVAVSDRDSAVAELAMLAQVAESGIDPSHLNPQIAQKLFEIASGDPEDDDAEALAAEGIGQVEIASWRLEAGLLISPADVAQWHTLFDNDLFARLVIDFTLRYMLITSTSSEWEDVAVLKFRHVEAGSRDPEARHISFGQRFGLSPYYYFVEVPAIGRSAREHIRVDAPTGIFIENVALIDRTEDSDIVDGHVMPAFSSGTYQYRVTHERAVTYTKGVSEGRYAALLAMRPRPRNFVRPALFSVLASVLLLAGGYWAEMDRGVLTNGRSSVEAAVAILLVFPSLSSAYIAREDEHDILRHLLLVPRIAVALSAIATILAGAIVVLELSRRATEIWWLSSASLSTAVALLLAAIDILSTRAFKADRSNMADSASERIVQF